MNSHYRMMVALVVALFMISFFVEVDSPTGYTVQQVGASNVDEEVEEALVEEEEVRVIVTLKDAEGEFFLLADKEADIEETKESLADYEFEERRDLEELDAFSGNIKRSALNKLKIDPTVEKVQIDHVFGVSLLDSVGQINASNMFSKVLINNITGQNIAVCVLDTGMDYTHPDLSDNYLDGYDYVNDDDDPADDHGHGTHVSGIVEGVAPGVGLIHIKVLNSAGSGFESDIAAGITWCINNRTVYNITVISMSLGAGEFTSYCDSSFSALTSAINNAIAVNITVIASSGNVDGANPNIGKISSPGCIENSTAVSAVDKSDAITSYGKLNNLVDILAPGSSIVSTANGGGTTTMTGTSMSAPHVTGAIALAQQFEFEESGNYLTASEAESAFVNNGVTIDSYVRIDVDDGISSLDNTIPVLFVDEPQNVTYSVRNISLNYTATDLFLDKVYYNLNDGDNVSLSGNTTVDLEGGTYTIKIYANDSNSVNMSMVVFGVDLPSVTLNSPEDNFNSLTGNLNFNCSVTDLSSLSNISLIHNLSGSWETNQTTEISGTSAEAIFNLNLTGNLVFGWNCEAFDSDGNSDTGENRTLRLNVNTAPVIDDYFPSDDDVNLSEPNGQVFNVSYTDADGDAILVNWYRNAYLVDSDDVYNFLGNYTSQGEYNITVYVGDSQNNVSNYWNFTILDVEGCGDFVKNGTEECDGNDYGSFTGSCDNYDSSFDSGDLSCSSSCIIDTNSCSTPGSGGSSDGGGGSGGGSSGGSVSVDDQQFNEGFSGGSNLEEGELSESETVEVEQESEAEETTEEIQEEEVIKDESGGNYIFGIIGVVVGLLVIYWFLRKEWGIIKRKQF